MINIETLQNLIMITGSKLILIITLCINYQQYEEFGGQNQFGPCNCEDDLCITVF